MACLIHPLIADQDQSRHEKKYGKKADGNSFCQGKTKVRTDAKTHHYKCQKSDNRGKSAGQNGTCRKCQRIFHGFFWLCVSFAFLKTMDQKYGIIQGNCQLQNISGRIGYKGDFSKYQVRSCIYEDCHAKSDEHDDRLYPGSGGQNQDHKKEQHRDHGNLLDL